MKGVNIAITSTTDDMTFGIVRVTAPQLPLQFFYADLKNHKLLQQLLGRPDLKVQDLAPVELIEYKARDGLKIRGYLTIPNTPTKTKLPMIVLVHGGPHGRPRQLGIRLRSAALRFAWLRAVLQVNYRGSQRSRCRLRGCRLRQVGPRDAGRHHRWRQMGRQ